MDLYILIWLSVTFIFAIIIVLNILENRTDNENSKEKKNFFQKFIIDVEKSFYKESATWNDIVFLHLSILAFIAFLLGLLSEPNILYKSIYGHLGSFAPILLAIIHIIIYLLTVYLFTVSGGKLAHTLGSLTEDRLKKQGVKETEYFFNDFQVLCIIIAYFILLFLFILL